MSENEKYVPKEKMSFLKWVDNFWYHNKAAVVIGFFAAIIVIVCSVQWFSKKDPDVFIYFVGHGKLSAGAAEEFVEDMELYFADDYNGDGHVVVDYKEDAFIMEQTPDGNRYVSGDPNSNVQFNKTQRFALELGVMTGDCVIYIMEPAFFHANTQYIADLEDVLGYVPESAIKGKGIPLSKLKAYKNLSLNRYPSDYIICMARKKDIFTDEYYNGNAKFFKNLIEYNVNTAEK